ncbi:hypothetical protein [Clostridium frigidicarnis]|uniref:Uncharacterized protein n=1 Tax=Clostridium frigidicarnis TaxID=84698 RepID=A0A1I0VU99_9CLOT|nr:hypothetical protein [Clostridium frigidicarnis]SFA79981.1 hypothetical protein SAMN04488528_100338 [Clostridium frigidicarnis]
MIIISTLNEINNLKLISKPLKEELLAYFQEIAEGIVRETWQDYNLSEVGSIVAIEDKDTIDVLDEFGLMQGNNMPKVLLEFALRVIVGETEMLKIIWVFGDSNGLSIYSSIKILILIYFSSIFSSIFSK